MRNENQDPDAVDSMQQSRQEQDCDVVLFAKATVAGAKHDLNWIGGGSYLLLADALGGSSSSGYSRSLISTRGTLLSKPSYLHSRTINIYMLGGWIPSRMMECRTTMGVQIAFMVHHLDSSFSFGQMELGL